MSVQAGSERLVPTDPWEEESGGRWQIYRYDIPGWDSEA